MAKPAERKRKGPIALTLNYNTAVITAEHTPTRAVHSTRRFRGGFAANRRYIHIAKAAQLAKRLKSVRVTPCLRSPAPHEST